MKCKKELKNQLDACKSIRKTMNIVESYELAKGLKEEFIKQVETLQLDVKAMCNSKEVETYENEKWWTTTINGEYMNAWIVFCKLNEVLGGI